MVGPWRSRIADGHPARQGDQIRQDFHLTIILVSHETEKVFSFCNRILVLQNGAIQFDGSPSALEARVDIAEAAGIYIPRVTFQHPDTRAGNMQVERDSYASLPVLKAHPSWPAAEEVPVLAVSHVTFAYPNGVVALQDVSVEVTQGEFLAIVGQNGSGKTTLAKLLNGLFHPQSGAVDLLGTDIRSYRITDIAKHVGYCFQNPDHQLFKDTIREEIAFGLKNLHVPPEEITRRCDEMVVLLGLAQFETLYASTLFVGKGIRQRVAIASILALQPEVLLIDEPTTGQDYTMIEEFMHLLVALHRRGHTIIIITHDSRVIANYAQSVLVMAGGRVVNKVPIQEFLADSELQQCASYECPDDVATALESPLS